MRASILAVGTELLRFRHADTNTPWLIGELQARGVQTAEWSQLVDDEARIAAAIGRAAAASDFVLVCGGLGPTDDDRTRAALARAAGVALVRDEEQVAELRRRFAAFGRTMSENNARQAERPEGADWLPNARGTAPGLRVAIGGTPVFALPGVPGELRAMFRAQVLPWIESLPRPAAALRTFRVAGRVESTVDAQLADLHASEGLEVTVLAGRDGLLVRLLAEGADVGAATERLDDAARRLRERLGDDVYAEGETALEEAAGRALLDAGRTVATAESCTAGLLAGALTRAAGSSAWFRGGWVVYHDDLKRSLAGVDAETLSHHGAVSEPVVRRLAAAVRAACAADYGVGISGIAGPGGGSPEKPVGLVHLALAAPGETLVWAERFPGDRDAVRRLTVQFALDRLRRHALGRPAGGGRR